MDISLTCSGTPRIVIPNDEEVKSQQVLLDNPSNHGGVDHRKSYFSRSGLLYLSASPFSS